jgi:hypothetical protein
MPPELATLPTLSPAPPTACHCAVSHTRERRYLCIHAIRRATLARPPAAAASPRCRYLTLPAKLPPLHAARQAAATSRCPPSCRHFTLPRLQAARKVAATARGTSSCSYLTPPFKLPPLHAARHAADTSRCRHITLPVKLLLLHAAATSRCPASCCCASACSPAPCPNLLASCRAASARWLAATLFQPARQPPRCSYPPAS